MSLQTKFNFFRERGWTEVGRVQHEFSREYGTLFRRGTTLVLLTDSLRATHYETAGETLEEFLVAHRLRLDTPAAV